MFFGNWMHMMEHLKLLQEHMDALIANKSNYTEEIFLESKEIFFNTINFSLTNSEAAKKQPMTLL